MSPAGSVRFSLKTKMLLLIGAVITILMLGISFGILFQWRSFIIERQRQNAHSLTRAFAISVLDALIYGENGNFQAENLLETYIADFQRKVSGIKYIAILDQDRRVIAHSDFTRYDEQFNDSLSVLVSHASTLISSIYENPEYGWVLETVFPLQIAGKRWGVLRMGFDARSTRAEIRKLFILLFSLTVLVISVTLLVLYLLINRLTNSLRRLVSVMDEIDMESEAPLKLPALDDEVGFLIQHFESLKQRLSHSRTQLLNAQKQIYQAEKLASIGRLASGVAHEINNPLNGIKNCVYAIQKDPEDRWQTAEYLELINEGLSHIETVIKKLLGFARQQSRQMDSVDMNRAVNKVLQLLDYRLTQKQVQVKLRLDENLPAIKADNHLMQEVIMNLLLNSFDAVQKDGIIEISSGRVDGHNIYISIKDNGIGISKENIERIFDPFYTTKEPGEGTGLGLSVSLGIVESHGGTIRVESTPGEETVFTIILPIEAQQ